MRTKASLFVAMLAAVAVLVPAGLASAETINTNLSQIINAGTLSVDVVDDLGDPIASPSVAFPDKVFSFSCQPSVATLGTETQIIKISNPLSGGVSITLNAVNPLTDEWSDGTNTYNYNDGTGGGCTNGQLAVSGGSFNKTAGTGSPTVPTPGGAFSGAAPVTLLDNTGTVRYEAELTGFTLTQQIPAEQPEGNYNLPMNIDYIAQ